MTLGRVLVAVALAGCVESSAVVCDDGTVCPEGDTCDMAHGGGCVSPSRLEACNGALEGAACTDAVIGDGFCDAGVCMPSRCGDGHRAIEEMCDGAEFVSTLSNCKDLGYYDDVPLACTDECEIDESVCVGFCGDNVTNGQEICDGSIAETCVDFGYGTGTIECATTCGPVLDECIPFGWRAIEMPANVRYVHGTSDSNIWVVGVDKMVQRYDGKDWKPVNVSGCATGVIDMIYVLSATDAFALDGNGILRITATGCTRLPAGGQPFFRTLWAASLDDAYVANENGIWHFDGTSWTSSLTTNNVEWLWGVGSTNVFAVSSATSVLYRNNGTSWSTTTTLPSDLVGAKNIWGSSADDFYVAGDDTSGHVLVKHYTTAAGWKTELSNVPLLSGSGISSVPGFGASVGGRHYIFARTNSFTGDRQYLVASDATVGGWINLDAPIPSGGAVPFVAPSGDVYLAAVQQPRIYVFEGSTRVEAAPIGTPGAIHALDANRALSLDGMRTVWSWDGLGWLAEGASVVDDILVDSDGNVLLLTADGSTVGIRRRTGAGAYVAVTDLKGTLLAGTSPTDLWVLADLDTVSHWNGSTSQDYDLPISYPTDLFAVSTSRVFAVSHALAGDAIAMWNGTAWVSTPAPILDVDGVFGTSATDVFAWGAGRLIHYDGTSWSMFASQPPESNIYGVVGTSMELFLFGDAGIDRYDGQQWTPVDSGDPFGVRYLSARGDSIYYSTQSKVRQLFRTRPW